MRACLQEVNKARGDRSLWQWFRGSRQAELVVIFGEDLAALLGLVFALAAVLLAVATGNPVWDAIGTIGIGALLIVVAVFVAIERSEEHTSELQSLMRISYAVFCLKKKTTKNKNS